MPNLADLLASSTATQTCSRCGTTLVLNEDNFFHRRRANGTIWVDTRCQPCRREVDRENRRLRAAGMPVRPRRSTVAARKFGVEIEYIGDSYSVAREMNARGVTCNVEGYSHSVRRSWKIVTDASVSGGYELVSPPLSGQDGLDQLQKACEALSAAGARVNRACGLHVHHDVRDLDAAGFGRLASGWSRNQVRTDRLVAASRRNSNWAQPLAAHEVRHIASLRSLEDDVVRRHFSSYSINRYRSLNVSCFPRYGTVEIRQHQGTLNFKKISAWIAYGQAFIAAAVAGEIEAAATVDELLDGFAAAGHLTADQATYLKARAAHFSGRPVAA